MYIGGQMWGIPSLSRQPVIALWIIFSAIFNGEMIEGDRRSTLSNDRLSVVGLGVCRRNRLVLLPEPPCQ
jgi:hypothetical protein